MKDENNNYPPEENLEKEQNPVAPQEPRPPEQNYDQLWDKYVRLCAEFDNSCKRWSKEREELIKFANYSLFQEFLIILDEAKTALKMAQEHRNSDEIIKGISLICDNFTKIFKRRQLEEIEAQGKDFDPHFHEIITSREVEKEEDEHKVLEEVQRGYMLWGKVLRTAKVIVGVKKKTSDDGR